MFSQSHYENLISKCKFNKMNFSTNWIGKINKDTLLLRHDIDFSLFEAFNLAKLELKLGIKSTFFFMITSNFYNLFSRESKELIKDIKKMGHKISIHFDPTAYKKINNFKIEKITFEKEFNVNVDIISIHRPNSFLNNNNKKVFGLNQTYQDQYFKNIKYISDSGGKDVLPMLDKYFKDTNRNGLHLLIHPIWWNTVSLTPTETLNRWKNNYLNFITKEIRLNCKTYKD